MTDDCKECYEHFMVVVYAFVCKKGYTGSSHPTEAYRKIYRSVSSMYNYCNKNKHKRITGQLLCRACKGSIDIASRVSARNFESPKFLGNDITTGFVLPQLKQFYQCECNPYQNDNVQPRELCWMPRPFCRAWRTFCTFERLSPSLTSPNSLLSGTLQHSLLHVQLLQHLS